MEKKKQTATEYRTRIQNL